MQKKVSLHQSIKVPFMIKYILPVLQMKTKRSIFFFLLLLGAYLTSNAQQRMNDYIDSWKQVEQLYDKGLNRSALQQVDKIYQAARR